MSNRLTLLLITQHQLARTDVAGGKSPRAREVWTRDRIPGESLATLADAAIRLGTKKTGDVWVFSSEFWTGVVHLGRDVASALDAEELNQAIALEAENFSGISAFDSRLCVKPLPPDESGEARWWVTQIPQRDWHEVDQVIQQFHGKLAGMGHTALATFPTGLREPGQDFIRQPWRLNQAFGEATISVSGTGDEVTDMISLGDLRTQRTQTQLLDWCDETAAKNEKLVWVSDQPLPSDVVTGSCQQIRLDDTPPANSMPLDESDHDFDGKAAVEVWGEAMAFCLHKQRGSAPRMPIAVARKPPMSSQTATLIACVLGLLFALGCYAVHATNAAQLSAVDSQINRFNKAKKVLAANKQSLQALKKQVTQQRESLRELRASNRKLSNDYSEAKRIRQFQKNRWVKLVSAIAKANDGGCWVSALKTKGNAVKVQGMAVSNQDISDFTKNLERFASPHGWRVHPAQTERNEMALVDFEVSLDVSDRVAPGPQFGSSVARSNSTTSLVVAPIQKEAMGENQ